MIVSEHESNTKKRLKEDSVPLKEDAKKGRLYTSQPSCHKINQWCTMGAVKQNSKFGTITTNKALSSKTKNIPQNFFQAIWNAEDAGDTPLIEWSIVKGVPPYQCGSKIC